jgi:hypothetical protein
MNIANHHTVAVVFMLVIVTAGDMAITVLGYNVYLSGILRLLWNGIFAAVYLFCIYKSYGEEQ